MVRLAAQAQLERKAKRDLPGYKVRLRVRGQACPLRTGVRPPGPRELAAASRRRLRRSLLYAQVRLFAQYGSKTLVE